MRVAVCQMSMGSYRQEFLNALFEISEPEDQIRFLVGDIYFDPTTITRVESPLVLTADRNRYLLGRRIAYQKGVLRECLASDVSVIEFNPRILTSWMVLVGRRLLKRPTLAWGHAWPRAGSKANTGWARKLMRSLATGVLVYTQGDASELAADGYRGKSEVVPNSVLRGDMIRPNQGGPDVILVGRLVAQKNPALAIQAFAMICESPNVRNLLVVGDGPLLDSLKQLAVDLGVADRVRFSGWISDAGQLSELFDSVFCALSPGYVGLSATQTAGYGIPLIFALDAPHAPEVQLLDDSNSVSFSPANARELADAILGVASDLSGWRARSSSISERIAAEFSADFMAERFLGACKEVCN